MKLHFLVIFGPLQQHKSVSAQIQQAFHFLIILATAYHEHRSQNSRPHEDFEGYGGRVAKSSLPFEGSFTFEE